MSFGRRQDMSHLHTTRQNNYIVALVWKIILHLQDDMLKIIKRCETQKCHRRINNLYSFLHRWCIDNNGLLKVNAARELFYQKFGMNEEIGIVGMIKCKNVISICWEIFISSSYFNVFLILHYILCYIFIKTIYQNNEALK